eukprot:NODE_6263_length_555_cov_18.810748_g6098_i0.p1 GENE.NODE_6263_length_555_cov_18.810748_g6098_i0~~NODE_6263_length_555_cov_18.810748_g6098_i0.p1  ORF type:complete len:161 (+),score=63.19 NODE_6263_length_555_cov_18.810748_g6098_i0:48-485(+)
MGKKTTKTKAPKPTGWLPKKKLKGALRKKSKTQCKTKPLCLEATIHLHKHIHNTKRKKRAGRAIKRIKQFAIRLMKTKDVRIDPKLNKYIWSRGIKGVPYRARLRLERKRKEDEDSKKKQMYTIISWVPVASYKGLENQRVDSVA